MVTQAAKEFISALLVKSMEKRMSAEDCLRHKWLSSTEVEKNTWKKINTSNLRKFLARRRWQRCGQAIR